MGRRMHAVVVAVALPLGPLAAPAQAAPAQAAPAQAAPAASRSGPPVEWREGTLVRLKTLTNTVVLADRGKLWYDHNDLILAQHLHDVADEDGSTSCDLFDSGGEETAAAFAASGLEVSVDYFELPRFKEISSVIFSIDTCDGVVDAADITPRPPQ